MSNTMERLPKQMNVTKLISPLAQQRKGGTDQDAGGLYKQSPLLKVLSAENIVESGTNSKNTTLSTFHL